MDLRRAFKAYFASKTYKFDQDVEIVFELELKKDSEGLLKAQLKSKDIEADFSIYHMDIETRH